MARRSLPLSTKVTLFFGVLALVVGLGLALATYFFARNTLLSQREASATTAAIAHARTIQDALANLDTVDAVLGDLDQEPGGYAVVLPEGFDINAVQQRELASRTGYSVNDFPVPLVDAVQAGQPARQLFESRQGMPQLGIAIPIPAYNTSYLEAFPLQTTQSTLRALSTALIVGAIIATVIALFFGWSTSRRLLQPISRVADAAEDIAAGALDARLDVEDDPDLKRLASSFNEMADAVQERIEREQRFTSDVSHELRSPITALVAGVEVLAARRDEFNDRTRQALDVVIGQVRRFDDMVIDLLELSRLEAGSQDINQEPVDLAELSGRVAVRYGHADLPIEVSRYARRRALVDRVRFERILGNLLDNATTHGNGPTRISIEPGSQRHSVLLVVEDAGPGVAASERDRIFERFARGSAARHRIGTGLGLALVSEHAIALGGEAWVEERVDGGARFVVRLPTDQDGILITTTRRRDQRERTPA